MTTADTQKDIDQLRAQIAELSSKKVHTKKKRSAAKKRQTDQEQSSIEPDNNQLMDQIDELVSLLEKEIQELPAISALVLFVLGVLFGRFLR